MRHPIRYATLPKRDRVFLECGCCGGMHHRDLPGHVDCRDDAHRFTTTQLDAMYGESGYASQFEQQPTVNHDQTT